MYYYTVLTLISNINELSLLAFCKELFDEHIIVLENGKEGNNPHYNLVYKPKSSYWGTNAKRMFTKLYPKNFEISDYLIKTKKANTWQNIVGGYLTKEQDYKIIINNNIDMDVCKKFADTNRELNTQPIKTIYEFVDFKIMPYKPDDVYMDADKLIETAVDALNNLNDMDLLRYFKNTRQLLSIVRSRLNQPQRLFSPFD